MKRAERTTAIILALIILTSSIQLTGCGKNQNTISVGQWLAMVNQAFGMETYQSEIPYFENIPRGSTYFETVQIAIEWEVIDKEQDIDVEEKLNWKTALITLMNVGNFLPADTSEEEKIEYAIEHFDKSIRTYWMKRNIEVDRAVSLLEIAHRQWAGATFDHVTEEVIYKPDVVDFTQEGKEIDNYVIEGNLVKIPRSSAEEIKEGDVYVLPVGEDNFLVQAYKADRVYQDEEYLYIENSTEELGLEDVAEEIFVEETYMPTMEKAIIYDGNGNILSVGAALSPVSYTEDGSPVYAANLPRADEEGYRFEHTADVKKTIKVDGYDVGYEFGKSGNFYFKASISSQEESKSKTTKLKTTASAEISNLEITNEIDWGLFKGLKSASLKVNYRTAIKGAIEASYKPPAMIVAPYNNGNGKFWSNLKRSYLKSETDKGAKTIKIASVDVYSIGLARACLDVNLKIEADGSFSVTITESGTKGIEYRNGNVRVINDSTRNTDVQLEGSIELTGGIGPAIYLIGLKEKVIGAQIRIGIGGEGRIATHLADPEMHLIDEMDFGEETSAPFIALNSAEITTDSATIEAIAQARGGVYKGTASEIPLHADVCIDIGAYFILRLELESNGLVGDLIGGGKSWELLGKDNARLFSMHVGNFDWALAWANKKVGWNVGTAACTLKYVPFDSEGDAKDEEALEDEKENPGDSGDTEDGQHIEMDGEMIVLDSVMLTASTGENQRIVIKKIPEGYTPDDLQFQSGDEKVVTVDENGNFIGVSEGSTVITISTKDGKYKAYCAVTIFDNEKVEFTPM